MTVQELRDLLGMAAPRPWRIGGELHGCIVSADDDTLIRPLPGDAGLIVAAVNALPALLDLADAVIELRGWEQTPAAHRPPWTRSAVRVDDALRRLGET